MLSRLHLCSIPGEQTGPSGVLNGSESGCSMSLVQDAFFPLQENAQETKWGGMFASSRTGSMFQDSCLLLPTFE